MMSILIKGIEIPKSCWDCFACHDGWCIINQKIEGHRTVTHSCPLIEVPTPHGQLIDIEPFMRGLYEEIQVGEITYTSQELYDMIDNEIKSMPTIIPAEEGET